MSHIQTQTSNRWYWRAIASTIYISLSIFLSLALIFFTSQGNHTQTSRIKKKIWISHRNVLFCTVHALYTHPQVRRLEEAEEACNQSWVAEVWQGSEGKMACYTNCPGTWGSEKGKCRLLWAPLPPAHEVWSGRLSESRYSHGRLGRSP